MKNKKNTIIKLFCILFAVCTVIPALTGCGKKPSGTESGKSGQTTAEVTEAMPVAVNEEALDINKDGDVNNKDVAILFRKVSKGGAENDSSLDLNQDGIVNNKDIASLFRYTTTLR